jgi:hypothetical protein
VCVCVCVCVLCFFLRSFFFINGGLNVKIMLLQMSFEQALDFRMSIGIKVLGRFCRFSSLVLVKCMASGLCMTLPLATEHICSNFELQS